MKHYFVAVIILLAVKMPFHFGIKACGISNMERFEAAYRSSALRIIGSREAKTAKWPWMVSLLRNGRHVCGATLIAERWIATAAHCVSRLPFTVLYRAVLGSNNLFREEFHEITMRISKILIHPLFNRPKTRSHDLALLKLAKKVPYSDRISPICLPTHVPLPGTSCVIIGWGKTNERSSRLRSEMLQEVALPLMPPWVCMNKEHYWFLVDPASMICAGLRNGGKDSCQGDSGGPLMCMDILRKRWELHGIISWGFGCGRPKRPGVYSKVLIANGWIRSQMILH